MNIEVRVATKVIIVFFLIVLQILCNLLFELNIIKPGLWLTSETLFSGRCVWFNLLRSSLTVLFVTILMISSFLFFLYYFGLLLNSGLRCSDGWSDNRCLLHFNIFLILRLLLILLTTSVTFLEPTSFFLASLVVILGAWFSARLNFLEIFHVLYI